MQRGHHGQHVARVGRTQLVGEHVRQIQPVALGGAAQSGQDLVGARASFGAVASRDLADHDRGPDLLLGQVVRGAQQWDVEVREDLVLVPAQVPREAFVAGFRDVSVEQRGQFTADLVGAGGVILGRQAVPHRLDRHAFEQYAPDGQREARGAPLLNLQQFRGSPQQVPVALAAPPEDIVCSPSVGTDVAAEVGAQDLDGDRAAPAQADAYQRDLGLGHGEHPEPGAPRSEGDVPAGLVGVDDRRAAHDVDQTAIGRLAALSDAPGGARQRGPAQVQAEEHGEDAGGSCRT